MALAEVGFDAGGGLIAFLGRLGEQLHNDRGNRRWNVSQPLAWRHRLSGDMAVNPLHGIGSRKRKGACQHLVERDPQRVEITTGIDRAVHPAGLFRRHVSESPFEKLGRLGRLALTRQA